MVKINKELTNLETGHFSSGAGIKELEKNIEDFFRDIESDTSGSLMVYLGDGGFSRLSLEFDSYDGIIVELTDNSTKAVKEKWNKLNEESEE